jgi:galactokinase
MSVGNVFTCLSCNNYYIHSIKSIKINDHSEFMYSMYNAGTIDAVPSVINAF